MCRRIISLITVFVLMVPLAGIASDVCLSAGSDHGLCRALFDASDDKALDIANTVRSATDGRDKADALAEADRAFRAYRDAECALEDELGFERHGFLYFEKEEKCSRDLTQQRMQEIWPETFPVAEGRPLQPLASVFGFTMAWPSDGSITPPATFTLADRIALLNPFLSQSWSFKAAGWPELVAALRGRGFGPRSAALLSRTWDAIRFDPETGERLHRIGVTGRWLADPNAIAASMPDCLRDLSEPSCKVRFSVETGCRYDEAMAVRCTFNRAALREDFARYDPSDARQTDRYYRSLACLVDARRMSDVKPPVSGLDGSPIVDDGFEPGRACADLGVAATGSGGFRAENAKVFGRAMTLVID